MQLLMAILNVSSFPLILVFLFSISLNLLISSAAMSGQSTAVHVVYTERPHNEEPEAYHIRTLASVLGRSVFSSTSCLYPVAGKLWRLAMNFGLIY